MVSYNRSCFFAYLNTLLHDQKVYKLVFKASFVENSLGKIFLAIKMLISFFQSQEISLSCVKNRRPVDKNSGEKTDFNMLGDILFNLKLPPSSLPPQQVKTVTQLYWKGFFGVRLFQVNFYEALAKEWGCIWKDRKNWKVKGTSLHPTSMKRLRWWNTVKTFCMSKGPEIGLQFSSLRRNRSPSSTSTNRAKKIWIKTSLNWTMKI